MKPVSIAILKKELHQCTQQEVIDLCLQLAKFKKENKELLSYALFDSYNEDEYVQRIKEEIDTEFSNINYSSLYFVKKGTRKILRNIKKYVRYSKKKETEASVLLYFCAKLHELKPAFKQSQQMINMYDRQLTMAKKAISTLHEDLQYDFNLELEKLETN
ncbi:hypothetical protein [Aquimarina agarilytica]|uniref:hypothetical protein n=1 Tax=Aquimarina agarilytica TaxID=1087449 RepID=UPI000289E92A|nr:hypothetical protein [Aquimarina agarilytica]